MINTSNIIVNATANDVSTAVIPNQPTGQVTVSGWGYIAGNNTGNITEAVNLPYKFNTSPSVSLVPAGYNTSVPTNLSSCAIGQGGSGNNVGADANSITTTGFNAHFAENVTTAFASGNYYCYTWTATGTVSPKQFVAVATGATGADGGDTIINETDGTAQNVLIGSQSAGNQWQNKIALTSNGTLYTAHNDSSVPASDVLVYYGVPTISNESSWAQYYAGYYQVGGSAGWSNGGPSILGSLATGQINSLYVTQGTSTVDGTSNTIYVGTNAGTTVIQEEQGNGNVGQGSRATEDGSVEKSGSVKYYTNTYATEEMVGDIRGMWPLSSNGALSMSDASIKGNTLTNNGTVTAVSGVRGMAANFNGSNYLSCTDANCGGTSKLDVGTGSWSVGAWIKTSSAGTQTIFGKGNGASWSYTLGTNGGQVLFNLFQAAGAGYVSLSSNKLINDNNWHYVVGVWNPTGTVTQIYVDGQLDNSTTTVSGTFDNDSTADFNIGRRPDNNYFFTGSIDEPFVTASALTAGQVKHMYDVGSRALQSHATTLGGGAADKNQQLAGSQTPNAVVLDAKPDANNQYLYVSSSEGGLNLGGGGVSKIQLNSDSNVYTYTNSSTPKALDSEITSLAVGYNLEAMSSTQSGTLAPGYNSNASGTNGIFYSKAVAIPEAISSAYLWTNTYTDASDGGSSLTVAGSNDGGSTYQNCTAINNDTNQTPQENEYDCRFNASNSNLKFKFSFARTATKENNYIAQYGVGWTATGADYAENYITDEFDIQPGYLVKTKTGGINTLVGKTQVDYDNAMIGVVSTSPGQTIGPDNGTTPGYSNQTQAQTISVPVALSGRVPVMVNAENGPIKQGDYITASATPGYGMKATKSGRVIGVALEDWPVSPSQGGDQTQNSVLVFLNPGYYAGTITADGSLPANDNIALVESAVGITNASTASDSGIITSLDQFMAGLTQNVNLDILQATLIKAEGITSTIIKGSQGYFDSLLATNVQTNLISPIPGETNLTVQIGSEATPSGEFVIENASGSAVAAIDNLGNARLQGDLSARQATFSGDATVSGTLYADNIQSKSLDQIKDLLDQVQTDQNVLLAATASADINSTASAELASYNQLDVSDLYVTNQGAFNSLSISNTLSIGSDMVFNGNSLNTLSAPLELQSLAMAPVEIMDGLVSIDTKGNVQIAGNLAVKGEIDAGSFAIKDATSSATLASIDASGSATFNSISASQFVIAGANTATNSGVINGVLTTNATAGSATIPSGVSEITIKNPKVTDYTLVYVTPTSTTQNNVLYVKSKQNGQFVVGFANPISTDVNFNWWIVQVTQ